MKWGGSWGWKRSKVRRSPMRVRRTKSALNPAIIERNPNRGGRSIGEAVFHTGAGGLPNAHRQPSRALPLWRCFFCGKRRVPIFTGRWFPHSSMANIGVIKIGMEGRVAVKKRRYPRQQRNRFPDERILDMLDRISNDEKKSCTVETIKNLRIGIRNPAVFPPRGSDMSKKSRMSKMSEMSK